MALLAGTAVNGIAAYLYIAIGTRTYGDAAMAPIAVLWTFWAVSVALFMFPLQHWAIRQISVDGDTRGVAGTVPQIAWVVVGLAGLLALGSWLASDRLFGSSDPGWAILVFLITVGSAFAGLQRGVLSGLGHYFATAANIAAENLLRLSAGIVVAIVFDSVFLFAAVLAIGPAVAVFWPETFKMKFRNGLREPAFAFLGGLAGGLLIAQIILNSGPVVLQAIGGEEAAVTALFLSLAVFRAPYLLALGVATRFTGPLTRMVAAGQKDRMRRLAVAVSAATIGVAMVGAVFGYYAGPWFIDLVFAPTTPTSAPLTAAIAAGSVLALGGLGLILMLTAQARTVTIQVAFVAALVVGVGVLLVWTGDKTASVVAAFVAAEMVALAAMTGALLARKSPAIDQPFSDQTPTS